MTTVETPVGPARTVRKLVLPVMCSTVVLVIAMQAAINLAVPGLATGPLHPSATQLVWLVDAYVIVFAGLLIPAGAAGDRFGRRRVLLAGLALFVAGSAVCALATSVPVFLAGRAITGLGAAAALPATLAVLVAVFPEAQRRAAIATWAGMTGVGGIVGNVGAGVLLEFVNPRGMFAVFAGFGLAAGLVSARVTPRLDPHNHPLDPVGTVTLVAGLVCVLDAIIEAPGAGWGSAHVLVALAAGAGLLAAFVAWELRCAAPILDPRVFRVPVIRLACLLIALLFVGMFGLFYLNAQYLEQAKGYDALDTGLALAPMAVGMLFAARASERVWRRIGQTPAVVIGLLLVAAGLFGFSTNTASTPYAVYVVWLLGLAAGFGIALPILSATIVTSMPSHLAGLGSGLNGATRELGSALGVALAGTILTTRFASGLSGAVRAAAGAGAHPNPSAVLARLAGRPMLHAGAVHAYTHALGDAVRVVGIAVLAGALLTAARRPWQS